MITEVGRVIARNGDNVWVQTIRQSACNSCSARQGCGQRVLASVSGGKANQVLVHNQLGANVGDEVTLAIGESALLGASILAYAVPLLLFVVGTVVGHQLMPETDSGSIMGGVMGLILGFGASRLLQARHGSDYAPKMLKIHPSSQQSAAAVPSFDNPTDW